MPTTLGEYYADKLKGDKSHSAVRVCTGRFYGRDGKPIKKDDIKNLKQVKNVKPASDNARQRIAAERAAISANKKLSRSASKTPITNLSLNVVGPPKKKKLTLNVIKPDPTVGKKPSKVPKTTPPKVTSLITPPIGKRVQATPILPNMAIKK